MSSLFSVALHLLFALCTGYKHASPAVDILLNKLPWQGVASKRAKRLQVEVKYARRVHFGRDGSRGRQRCRQRWRRYRQRQQRAKYQKIKGILTAKRCAAAFQCKQSTRLATRAARQREKGREEADEVKRARSCSLLALLCPGLACLCLRCLQPFGPWRMCCACCGLRP